MSGPIEIRIEKMLQWNAHTYLTFCWAPLFMERFSASEARLESKSPVRTLPLADCAIIPVPAAETATDEPAGWRTSPSASNTEPARHQASTSSKISIKTMHKQADNTLPLVKQAWGVSPRRAPLHKAIHRYKMKLPIQALLEQGFEKQEQ